MFKSLHLVLQVVEMFYERQVINYLKYFRQIKLVLPMQTIDINYTNNDKNYCNFVKIEIKNKINMYLTRERRKLEWMWLYTLWTSLSAHRTPATTPWRSGTTCRGPRENCMYNIRDIVISIIYLQPSSFILTITMMMLLRPGMTVIIIC